MREICTCNCCATPSAPFVSPWCELLKDKDASYSVLHLWYKLNMVRDEIEKRTSYLGKLRRTEEAQHLLDLIAMTEDEKDLFMPFAKAAMADVYDVLHSYMPKHEKAYWWREGRDTVVFTDDPLPDPPVEYHAGQYVEFNGDLYIAIKDGNSDDITGKLLPTEDYRESMHYGILWHCCQSNINVVEPLDVAIFEALVARIIYKWLLYSYPDESQRYLAEWAECMESIRKRASWIDNTHFVSRIPRIL